MKFELHSFMEEIISVELSEAGISDELIDKIIDSIKYNCKETNYLHNSVADSNYYGAIEREENQKIKRLEKEKEQLERKIDEIREDHYSENKRLRWIIQDLKEEKDNR